MSLLRCQGDNNQSNLSSEWLFTEWAFNECIQHTFLLWLPCLLFWLLVPCELAHLRRLTVLDVGWSKLTIARFVTLICSCCCLIILLISSTLQFRGPSSWRWTIAFSYGALLASFITSVYLIVAQQKKRVASCRATWMMLFVALLAGLFEFSTSYERFRRGTQVTGFDAIIPVAFVVYYKFTFVSIILLSFSFISPPFVEEESTEQPPWPEEYCSFSSQMFYSWFSKLIWTGYKRALELRNVWFVAHAEQENIIYAKFGPHWQHEYGPAIYSKRFGTFAKPKDEIEIRRVVRQPSFVRIIFKTWGWRALKATFFKLINDMFLFVDPFIVRLMIAFYSDPLIPTWHGFVYVILIGASMIVKAAAINQYFYLMSRLGVQARTAIVSAIYRKSLRLTTESRSSWTTGEIVNMMSVDASRFRESAVYVQLAWSAPLQVIVGITCIYTAVGHAVWAGVAFLIIVGLANATACKFFEKLTEKQMIEKDKRMKLLTEVLNGIKVIKLYAWELAFRNQVETIRTRELKYIRNASYIRGMILFAWTCTTIFSCLVIFGTYLAISPTNSLTAEKVFFVLAVFGIIEYPLAMMPELLADLMMISVSVKRLSSFFSAQERTEGQIMRTKSHTEVAIKISKGFFTWESSGQKEPTLQDMDFEIRRGQLCAVVGSVGCGKSSLLSALCGDMHKVSGVVQVDGSVAYAAQQPWIRNLTLRNNVLFGRKFDKAFYEEVLEACALNPDIAILSGGDMAEIGERGVNLSGGQKQRLSLARCIYQNQDVYLLDDPLSAVDVYVGRHLFNKVIGPEGMLKDKTRILVTHDLSYLKKCDLIFVMKDGRICEKGSYRKLLERNGSLAALMKEFRINQRTGMEKKEPLSASEIIADIPFKFPITKDSPKLTKTISVEDASRKLGARENENSMLSSSPMHSRTQSQGSRKSLDRGTSIVGVDTSKTLISDEIVQVGKISWAVYCSYARSSGFGLIFYFVFLALSQICGFLGTIWLQKWTDFIGMEGSVNSTIYSNGILYYGLCAAGQVLFTAIFVVFFAYFQVQAAKRIHSKLLYAILRAPLSFFNSTPTGRIVNRCGKDINAVDNEIPIVVDQVSHAAFLAIQAVIGMIYATPFFAVAVIPSFLLYYFVQRFYVKTSRQLRRLEAVTRSPIFSLFQDTLHGVSTIRAFEMEEKFIDECSRMVDVNSSAQIALFTSNRWIGMRLDTIGALLVCSAVFVIVLMRDGGLTPGLVGLSISFALSMTGLLAWGVQQTSVLETEIVAIERINEYISTPSEAEWDSRKPLKKWPLRGFIDFKNYSIQYRSDFPLVLRNLTFKIEPGQKIGVIGRTGAGKTSLTLGLFRLVEAASGRIFIDDVEISSIGLHDLRKRLTIIPQDPVLFTGTLRFNIDPFNECRDSELWSALELSRLKAFFSELPAGLNYDISEGGSNLSVGQRQLVCLARALLRKSKIIVLDEATAAVDTETDAFVQNTVRTHFNDCTIITIAHRLNSVRECNMILVLENGEIVEYDKPETLLQKPDSYYRMIIEAHAGQFSHSGTT